MNGKQKEFLAKSGINLTDGLVSPRTKDSMKSTFSVF